jgi:hypothetical protein
VHGRRVIKEEVPGLANLYYDYDERGCIISITEGEGEVAPPPSPMTPIVATLPKSPTPSIALKPLLVKKLVVF